MKSWQGKSIYFVLIDRFCNGDKSNDDFGKGEYGLGDDDRFQGGDLKGVAKKLSFIKKMGFDALWITPPVHNQWINPYIATRGFHGYWAYDFTKVDPHFGSLADYKALVAKAHRLGIKVIQDIVVNHTGNYFTIDDKKYDPQRPEKGWKAVEKTYPPGRGAKAPKDPVFRMNNPNIREHREAAVYNFTPNISDFKNREQTLTYSLGDLDDINLHSPLAVRRFKEIYRYWIEAVGVDGFRVDTVYYTPEDFYEGFLYDDDPKNLGVKRCARDRGIEDFFVFGEVWSYDYKAINRYLKDGRTTRLDSAIDLPLNEALTRVFYRKAPTEALRESLSARRHNRNLWVNFLDNHDVERMNGRADWAPVKQSLVALFTLPGIPCVYYGTEAGFKDARQNMFAAKHYNENSKHFKFLRRLIRFRKAHPALSAGSCRIERASFASGVLSYSIAHAGEEYLAVFNTSADTMLYDFGGRVYDVLLCSEKDKRLAGAAILAPESYYVLKKARSAAASAARTAPAIRMRALKAGRYAGGIGIRFNLDAAVKGAQVFLVSDDNYAKRIRIKETCSGIFRLDGAELGNGRHKINLLAVKGGKAVALSAASVITVNNPFELLAHYELSDEDKAGIGRLMHPPADSSYGEQLSMDSVSAYSSGKELRLKIRMKQVTDDWNPPNGYDHVYFNIFFDFPGRRGKRFFPKMDYAREDFEFNAGFLFYGWGSQSFGAKGSTKDAYGDPLIGEVTQSVELKKRTITFTFSKSHFDSLKSLAGMKVFVSTWDGYLAEFRPTADKREDWSFYTFDGGSAAGSPKVFDHALIEV